MKKLTLILILLLSIKNLNAQKEIGNNSIDRQAEFIGGQKELFKYLSANFKYPESTKNKGIYGVIYVQFIVDTIGEIKKTVLKKSDLYQNIESQKSSGKKKKETIKIDCDTDSENELIRVINSMPRWQCALFRGKPVSVQFTVPMKLFLN
jgi:hypothetical protein